MTRLRWLVLVALTAGCSPLRDAGQVRDDLLLARVDGVVDGQRPDRHDEGLRVGALWVGGDGARYLGASTPLDVENGGYAFHLEIRASSAVPNAIAYAPGWWVAYFILFQDVDGDGTAKLIGNSFGNDLVLGAAPNQLLYRANGESLPPWSDGGVPGTPAPSGFLVDDGSAELGYHLAEGVCAADGSLSADLHARVLPDGTLVHVAPLADTNDWYPHGRIPGGCLGL